LSILPNMHLSSTTYVVEEVKIRRPRRAQGAAVSGANVARGWRGLTRLDWRKRTHMTLEYVHGAHPRVKVTARGREWLYDWDQAVLDILRDVCNRDTL